MSAPIQASASVHVVPASNCVRSSTRIPESKPGDRGVTSIGGSLPEWEGGRGQSFYPRWPTGRSSTVVVVVTNTDIPTRCSRGGGRRESVKRKSGEERLDRDADAVSSYGIRIGEVRILSPTPAMIIVGVAASPSAM